MKRNRAGRDKFIIKIKFNPDHPLDKELMKVLKQQANMTAYIKFALYQHINGGERDGALKRLEETSSLMNEAAVSPVKEKQVNHWDKDAAFADAFEPLK